MKQYLNLLQNIIDNGVEKESGRANMPNTIGISFGHIEHDLKDGFPLLTTKKMYWKGIIHELLWFLRGETNIKYLIDNNVNIWNGDAYRWYINHYNKHYSNDSLKLSIKEFIEKIKENKLEFNHYSEYKLGDLGKVYGYQWRNQNGIDQIKDVINGLKNNPYSRYHIIDGWNKADFKDMALPPCHLLYQFIVRPLNFKKREKFWNNLEYGMKDGYDLTNEILNQDNIPKFYLDLNMYQRSVDTFLGAPFNIASMSILNMIFAKTCNMISGKINWIGGDTHLYVTHLNQVKEQLQREPMQLPEMKIKKDLNSLEDILNLTIDDFELINYNSHSKIKAELSVGL